MFDPISDTKARLDRYDEEYEVAAKPVKKALKAKPSLRQSNAQLLSASDKRYAGTKVSRRDLEEDFQEPDMEDSDEEESEAEEIEEFNKKFAKLGSASKSQSIQGKQMEDTLFSHINISAYRKQEYTYN